MRAAGIYAARQIMVEQATLIEVRCNAALALASAVRLVRASSGISRDLAAPQRAA
jgi:hypothetical protein